MKLLKKLWVEEPVIVSGALSLAVSLGVLTATDASAIADAVAGVVVVVTTFLSRSRVSPAAT